MADEAVITEPGTEAVGEPKEKPNTVPLSALLGEREKYQGRETELRATIDTLSTELRTLKGQVEKKVQEAPADEKAKARREWSEFLGLDKLEEKLSKIDAALTKLDDLAARLPAVEHGSNLAFANYTRGVELYVSQQYDAKTMPVTASAWQKMVAGEMSEAEAVAIANGDTDKLNAVIERTKKEFTPSHLAGRTREVQHVRALPKTPGAGGVSPGSEPKENKFTSLRDLHKQAGDDFAAIREREKG